MNVLPSCMSCEPCVYGASKKPENGNRFLGTGIKDYCEALNEFCELNPHPLKNQQVLITTESFL